ncbi:MAG: ABC transporter permease [Candidatus Faecivicinus sp.]
MLKFALKNMLVHRGRMALVTLSIVLSACVALLAYNISQQVSQGIISTAAYYDIIMGPAGSSTQLAMNTMFFTDEPLGTISYDYVEELQASGLTNAVVPFTMGDSYNGAKIVGTTADLLEGKAFREGRMFDEPFEAVVGSSVAERCGLKIGDSMVTSHGLTGAGHEHAASPMIVTGILAKTDTAYDNVIFTHYETVWAVHGLEEEEEHETSVPEVVEEPAGADAVLSAPSHTSVAQPQSKDEAVQTGEEHADAESGQVCAILIRSKSFNDYYKLMSYYGGNASLLCINPSTVLREVLQQVDLSTQIVYILCAIILLMNIVVISVITLLNMYDAQKEIALMRLIGIGMRRIAQLYLIQNGLVGLISSLLALLLSHLCLGWMGDFVASRGIVLSTTAIFPMEWAILALVFVLSVLPTMVRILFMSRRDSIAG